MAGTPTSDTDEPVDLIPLETAAERIGVSRTTFWRRAKEWGVSIYDSPLDRRRKFVMWSEVQWALRPRKVSGPGSTGESSPPP